ncbi:MAG TPA: helix-turn-helix domain-containing protein [Gemmatimonadales bacterium]|nr:helix-turn-helix domain-containing protein [Gemmatimonadales bacterium]
MDLPDLEYVDELARVRVLLHPLRLAIMELAVESTSATDAARRLNLPRQAIHYHVVALERAKFLVSAGEIRRRNMAERRVRASARSYLIAPEILGGLSPGRRRATRPDSPQGLLSLTARMQTDVSAILAAPAAPVLSFTSKLRFSNAAGREAFSRALGHAVAQLIKEHGLLGNAFREAAEESTLALALYPLPRVGPGSPTYIPEDSP